MAAPRPAELPLRLKGGYLLTRPKAEILLNLARTGQRGSCALNVLLPGGVLAAFVQFGLAEHAPDMDALGDRRYRVTAEGLAVLGRLGVRTS